MTRATTMLAALGVLSLGCTEYDLLQDGDTQDGLSNDGEPNIVVDPTSISFERLEVTAELDNNQIEVVSVSNDGDAALHINDIYLADGAAEYDVSAISSVLIQPGSTATFTVTFTPQTAGAATDAVLVESDDPDSPVVEVQLDGQGIAPVIDVSPTEYNFGELYVGCEGLQPITITNVGNADLIIDSFEFNTASIDDVAFDDATATYGALPWTLEPEQSADVMVSYLPLDDYDDIAYLVVASNDPYTPEVMSVVEGSGYLAGATEDVYEQPVKGMTDILISVDRSCSMTEEINNVIDNFGVFVETMVGLEADFHVAATVNDNGCIVGGDLYIDDSFTTTEAVNAIETMIDYGGSYGSYTEMQFMLQEAALSEAVDSGGCNYGLIREDAVLNLVGVSDEPSQDTNSYTYYVSLFQSLKENPDDVIFHAVGGDYPGGCATADAFENYYQAVVATGGTFLSICSTDFGSHLEDLAEGSAAQLDTFELTEEPVPDTIEVAVDGLQVTVGWEYDISINSVVFDTDHIPDGGSTIVIDYALYGDCEG